MGVSSEVRKGPGRMEIPQEGRLKDTGVACVHVP